MSYKKKLEECKEAECNPIDSDYRIFTKDDYIRYVLSRMKASSITKGAITQFKESWEGISKGYNFIIGIGQYNNLMFFSVQGFNEHILGNKEESKRVTIKVDIDKTEFEKKLERVGNQLSRIKVMSDVLEFDKDLSGIKAISNALEFERSLNKIENIANTLD